MGREQRQNPRWPNSSVWDDEQRAEHRRQRERLHREAGLSEDDADDADAADDAAEGAEQQAPGDA